MGDRVTVTLRILPSQEEATRRIFKDEGFEPDQVIVLGKSQLILTEMTFFGLNYGMLPGRDELRDAGIAYSLHYEGSCDWGPGDEHVRFTPEGKLQHIELAEVDQNPPLSIMIRLAEVDPKALAQYVLDYREKITPLPWDNQEEYGRIYMATKLIMPAGYTDL